MDVERIVLRAVARRAGRHRQAGGRQLPVGLDGERKLLPAERESVMAKRPAAIDPALRKQIADFWYDRALRYRAGIKTADDNFWPQRREIDVFTEALVSRFGEDAANAGLKTWFAGYEATLKLKMQTALAGAKRKQRTARKQPKKQRRK
jgi:hypothetical protein